MALTGNDAPAIGAGIDPGGIALLGAVAVETVLAVAAIVSPDGAGPAMFAAAVLVAIATIVLVTRSTLPHAVQMAAILGLCALLLAMGAVRDPFGLRTLGRHLAIDTTPAQPTVEAEATARAAGPLTVRPVTVRAATADAATPANATANAYAAELARLANARIDIANPPDARIESTLEIVAPPTSTPAATPTYRVNWSLARADERLWCGRMTIVTASLDAAYARMETRFAEALAHSRHAALACA